MTVAKRSKQTKEIRARWAWTEPQIWTDRMLSTLESGVKGGKWFSLIDKVWRPATLRHAFSRVAANRGAPGVDHIRIDDYERELDHNTVVLSEALREGDYSPLPIKRCLIPKPGSHEKRPLGIPCVRDRVVQTALRSVIEPIFEKEFADGSYGFRPGRGCKDALREVSRLLKAGYTHVVDVDLRRYFDTIPHSALLERIERKISDGRVLSLIKLFLTQEVMEGMDKWTPDEGVPQGAVLSPLLSNIYLNPLDHLAVEEGLAMIRYADDLVIMCRTADEASRALALVQQWTDSNGLQLHPEKTCSVDLNIIDNGFEFLGYRFQRVRNGRLLCWASTKSMSKLRATIKPLTKRCNGRSMAATVEQLNPILCGWFEYFKHGNTTSMTEVDKWLRMRLRSILRKRHKRKGRGRGLDHSRWPNSYFHDMGLFSLEQTHIKTLQSLRGTC